MTKVVGGQQLPDWATTVDVFVRVERTVPPERAAPMLDRGTRAKAQRRRQSAATAVAALGRPRAKRHPRASASSRERPLRSILTTGPSVADISGVVSLATICNDMADPLTLFRRALFNGPICIPFGNVTEAKRCRKACYRARDAIRVRNWVENERARPNMRALGRAVTFDEHGTPIGFSDLFYPELRKTPTQWDCLQFRVTEDGDLVIRAVTERVLEEPKALPAHPEPYDLSPAEVRALPRWPRNQFTGRVA